MEIKCFFSKSTIWDKVIKNGPSEIYGRQPLKNLKGYGVLKKTISLKIFKGYLPQNLLGPFLNTLSQIMYTSNNQGIQKSLQMF